MSTCDMPDIVRCHAAWIMKAGRALNFLIAGMALSVVLSGFLNPFAFADDCQTTSAWGQQTTEWISLRVTETPVGEVCYIACCYFGYSYYLGYYDINESSSGSPEADEIVVGGKTDECESVTSLWSSRDQCAQAPMDEYPVYTTTEYLYIGPKGG